MYTEIKLYFVENPFRKKSILPSPEIYVCCRVFRLKVKLCYRLYQTLNIQISLSSRMMQSHHDCIQRQI